jgi:hypothetical protein
MHMHVGISWEHAERRRWYLGRTSCVIIEVHRWAININIQRVTGYLLAKPLELQEKRQWSWSRTADMKARGWYDLYLRCVSSFLQVIILVRTENSRRRWKATPTRWTLERGVVQAHHRHRPICYQFVNVCITVNRVSRWPLSRKRGLQMGCVFFALF